MTDLTITKEVLQGIAEISKRHMKAVVENVMEGFPHSPETAYPLAVGYMVAISVNSAKDPERKQTLVRLLNSAIAGCGLALTPTPKDHDA